MKDAKTHLYADNSETLQIPYEDYASLVEKMEEAKRLQEVREAVVADLQHFLEGGIEDQPVVKPEYQSAESEAKVCESEVSEVEKVSPEFSAEEAELSENPRRSEEPDPHQQLTANSRADMLTVPPIKQEIVDHFNKLDESGRLFNVFKQYYTYLNKMCGGTVRVTMKDGICSLWNYDEWEEFAFVDMFEGFLRIAFDPRYTDALKSLSLCEVPRLISSRRNMICVQIDDLNNVVLDVLAKAFSDVGILVK